MTAKRLRFIPALVPLLLLISCGSEQQPQQQSYKDTKSMVIDVLKTEEAQQAIQEASDKNKSQTMKLLSTGEGQQIQMAVKEILTTENYGVKMLETTMTDPKFAGDFAKASQKTLKQMHKDLMKDPEYQKSLFEAFNNPDYQKLILETMKGQKYRQQMMEVIRESLQSPLFKAELIAMFQKAVKEELKPKDDKSLTITQEGGGKQGEEGKQGKKGQEGDKSKEEGGGGEEGDQGEQKGGDGQDDQSKEKDKQ